GRADRRRLRKAAGHDHVGIAEKKHAAGRMSRPDVEPPGLVERAGVVREHDARGRVRQRRDKTRERVLLDDDRLDVGRRREPGQHRVEIGAPIAPVGAAIGDNRARAHRPHLTPGMLISALTVTREGALPRLALAIGDLARQSHAERELVVVHDADAAFHAAVELLARRASLPATVERIAPGQTLGELRNRAVSLARGALVAQWDDDDRHHPERLGRQAEALASRDASFSFLTEQLHHFPKQGALYWEDWSPEPYPLDFVQGTIVARRERMPTYAPMRRGEDTAL